MNIFLKLIIGTLLIFFSCSLDLNAQTQTLTLSEAIEIGLRNNYQIKISDNKSEIARNNNTWKNTGRYPTVDLNVFYNNTLASQKNPFAFVNGEYYDGRLVGNVDAGWILFDGFKVDINKRRLEELERQTNSNAKVLVENTIQQIINAYYNTLIQQERLRVFEEVLEISADRVRYQNIRAEYGQSSTYDIIQSEDAFLNDSTNLIIQRFSLGTAKRNLLLAMGEKNIEKEFILVDRLEAEITVYDYMLLEDKLLHENKDLQNLMVGRELAAINTELAKSDRAPKIDVNGGINFAGNLAKLFEENPQTGETYDGAWGRNTDLYINFRGTYNIFNAGAHSRNIENAQVEEIISDLSILDAKKILTTQLRNVYEDYENQRTLLSISDKLIANAEKNLEVSTERFKAGKLSSFDFRAVQLAYINAVQSKLNAIFNLKNTETEMIKLVGGLVR